jgi:hypothetical protein
LADVKISGLPASTTPLAGTEVLPVVQSGATKQVSVANLTAGRAVSAASLALTTSPLPTTSGGTGLTSFTNKGVPYASSTSALTTGTGLQFDGIALGVGIAPQAWIAGYRPLQLGTGVCLIGRDNDPGMELSTNSYRDSGGTYKYLNTQQAGRYSLYSGVHAWDVAVSGTAGNTITWVGAMQIANSGGVTIGGTANPGAGNLSIANGNLVIGTSGKGIDFSATAGTGTSELLADYEEGTWTPSVGGNATYLSSNSGRYTKIGNVVHVEGILEINVLGTGSVLDISGLPFTSNATNPGGAVTVAYWAAMSTSLVYLAGAIANNSSVISMRYATAAATGLSFSGVFANGSRVDFAGSYTV